ncbi:uracil-DNA glycosylase [Desulfatiferula olefinivorans]
MKKNTGKPGPDVGLGTLIDPSWADRVPMIEGGAALRLLEKTRRLRRTRTLYPEDDRVFAALKRVPFDAVRVVILGQDPYHGEGQAMGLAFSVPEGVAAPPSLKNIFRELAEDTGLPDRLTRSTDLGDWADQGVLLLNTSLTVEQGKPGAHKTLGWTALTDQIITTLSEQRRGLVFMLWGAPAQARARLIDPSRHLILTAPHPSPLSAYRGFFGCRHFSAANAWLTGHGYPPITW